MNKIPNVWVVQEGNNDYSSAEEFGTVRFVTKGDLRNLVGCDQNKQVENDIKIFNANYLQGTDYIVVVGNPMISVLLAMSIRSGSHKFLKWDGRRSQYIPFILDSNLTRN